MPPLLTPPPASLTVKCELLPAFEGTTADDVVSDYLNLVALYRDCSVRHNALVDAL